VFDHGINLEHLGVVCIHLKIGMCLGIGVGKMIAHHLISSVFGHWRKIAQ
jgi:hypothetical protein